MEKCNAADARIVTWVENCYCALALGAIVGSEDDDRVIVEADVLQGVEHPSHDGISLHQGVTELAYARLAFEAL